MIVRVIATAADRHQFAFTWIELWGADQLLTPLAHIPVHVKQAPVVGHQRRDRECPPAPLVVPRILREASVLLCKFLVSLAIMPGSLGTGPTGKFPLEYGRQAVSRAELVSGDNLKFPTRQLVARFKPLPLAEPIAICGGSVPGNLVDRTVG